MICLFYSEYFLEDSDLDGLSDITVSSVHTSDLSSFEEQSDDDELPSDSSEEGELPSDGLNFLFLTELILNSLLYHKALNMVSIYYHIYLIFSSALMDYKIFLCVFSFTKSR